MSYLRLLFITHIAAAWLAGLIDWGSLPGVSSAIDQGAILCLLGLAAGGCASWWLNRALQKISTTVTDPSKPTGIQELDHLAGQLRDFLQHERQRWRSAERLLDELTPPNSEADRQRHRASRGQQLMMTLGQLARSASSDIGRIMELTDSISRRTHESQSGAAEQGTVVERTITAVENLSANIDLVSQNAEAANHAATEARESAVHGQELVQELIKGMERIALNVQAGEKRVLALGERSQEIGSIVETIGSISARTDMLALNASIEAVRAGEDGQGFAVVAEEVRKLAEHTANASREIANLVEAIQIETQDTISTMADEHTQVQQEVSRVNEAGVALNHINRTSNDSAERVGEISRATLEQLRGTQEVVRAMQQVFELANGIQQRAEDVRAKVTEVSAAARDLEDRFSPMYRIDQNFSIPADEPNDAIRSSGGLGAEGSFENWRSHDQQLVSVHAGEN